MNALPAFPTSPATAFQSRKKAARNRAANRPASSPPDDHGPTREALSHVEVVYEKPEIAGEQPRILKHGAHKRLATSGAISREAEAEAERYCEHYEAARIMSPPPRLDYVDETRARSMYPRRINATTYLRFADERLAACDLGTVARDIVIAACCWCRPMEQVGNLLPGRSPPRPPDTDDKAVWEGYAEAARKYVRNRTERAERALIAALKRLAREEMQRDAECGDMATHQPDRQKV